MKEEATTLSQGQPTVPQDQEIVDLLFARDEAALSHIQQKYARYCHRIAENILGNHADAEECVNDTYLRAWESIPPQKPSILSTYLGTLTRHIALNRARRERAAKRGGGELPLILDELQECIADPDAAGSDDEQLSEAIDDFLGTLPQRNRMVFVRRYWYADGVGQIARDYGMSENSVSALLWRTRKQMRTFLEKREIYV
jgi:RNA polymerase sigma-70 factor (ECF subfamily)